VKRVVRCVAVWLAVACGLVHPGWAVAAETITRTVRVGVTRGVHAEILDAVKRVAATRGLGVDVVEFDDASRIDVALGVADAPVHAGGRGLAQRQQLIQSRLVAGHRHFRN